MDEFSQALSGLIEQRRTHESDVVRPVWNGRDEWPPGNTAYPRQAPRQDRKVAQRGRNAGQAIALDGAGIGGIDEFSDVGQVRGDRAFFREAVMNGGALFVVACFLVAMAVSASITVKILDLERARVERVK